MTSRPVSFPQLGCTAQLYDLFYEIAFTYCLLPFSIYAFMPIWGLRRLIASRLTSRFFPSTFRHLSLLIQFLCWPHLPSLDSPAICYAIYRPPRFCSCLSMGPNHNIYVNISTVCMSVSKLTAGLNGHVVPTRRSALDPANYPPEYNSKKNYVFEAALFVFFDKC